MLKRAVITGMGVVSPNGIGKTAFCRAILAGTSGVKQIARFDTSDLPVKIAGEIRDFNEEDWLSDHERKHVSRVVPLAIAASTEALKDAGIDPEKLSLEEKREIGVVMGSGGGAQDFSELQYHLYYTGKIKQVSLFSIPSGTMGTFSSEINMRFGFRGMSHVITTGCTSSTDALAYALRQIQLGALPMMLAGGVDAPLAFGIMKGFTLMRIMTDSWNHAPERGSRPFNIDRDGFVVAEGAWIFMVEEYEHARARGAHILAEIVGYGSTCEAFHRVRLEECGEEPARAIQLAMREAGISAGDVQYVNLHGTSTQLNDRIETRALKLALGEQAYQVPMSSLKSQIGHPQGACGAAGVAATLVAMEHGLLPPTINLEKPDPDCDLDYIPQPGRRVSIENAVCNCIAFGSKNSALVLRRV
ncbi:MAG TPA: beta-ketoacyl-[acyl-carrier-protein] synthase family protein [Candidatus Angelobacter sp.]|jgi:3-oxoacyl-[acyl-carrier-protein] synthase II|nr:beta-ketoacyl-[acyl-carrier-protein] synthase family protein [Candidatus Angelobacter sp.]